MSGITVSTETLQRWYDAGVSRGAVAMTIMTDTFPIEPEQYPEYTIPGKNKEPHQSMQITGRTLDLTKPLVNQLPSSGCSCRGPCCCG